MSRTTSHKLQALVLGRDRSWCGGVVEYLRLLLARLPPDVNARRLTVGARPGDPAWAGLFRVLSDSLRLAAAALGDVDLCHLNPSLKPKSLVRDGLYLMILALARKPCVVLFHGFDRDLAGRIGRSALYRRLFSMSYGRARQTLVLASAFQRDLAVLGVDPGRVHVVSAIFDRDEIPSRREKPAGEAVTLLFMSRMAPGKGALSLLRAFKLLTGEFPGLRLVLAGDGPQRPRIQEEAFGVEGVVLTGHVTGRAKRDLLAEADIFVLPTRLAEGCPMALVEAMAAGLCVAVSPEGGVPDAAPEGEHAVFLRDPGPTGVANSLRGLIRDPERRRRMGEANRARAFEHFEAGAAARSIAGVYRRAVQP